MPNTEQIGLIVFIFGNLFYTEIVEKKNRIHLFSLEYRFITNDLFTRPWALFRVIVPASFTVPTYVSRRLALDRAFLPSQVGFNPLPSLVVVYLVGVSTRLPFGPLFPPHSFFALSGTFLRILQRVCLCVCVFSFIRVSPHAKHEFRNQLHLEVFKRWCLPPPLVCQKPFILGRDNSFRFWVLFRDLLLSFQK